MPDRVTLTEAARMLHKTDKTIRSWLAQGKFPHAKKLKIKGLKQWAIPLADIEAVREEEDTDTTHTTDNQSDLLARIEALEQRVTVLESKGIGLISPAPILPVKKLHKQASSDLPEGYVPLADFYHDVPHNTLYRRIKDGTIEITEGHWIHNGHAVEKALSPEQQALFYEMMHTHPSFIACSACPHLI